MKTVFFISGSLGMLCGIAIIVISVLDMDVPKPVWLVFGILSAINAIGNLIAIKRSKAEK